MELLSKYVRDESGATAIEYGLIATLIGVAIVGGARSIGVSIVGLFSSTDSELVKAFAP